MSSYENGKRTPEVTALQGFAKYFGVSLDYLLGHSDVRSTAHGQSVSATLGTADLHLTPGTVSNVVWPPIPLVKVPVIGTVPAGYLDMRDEEVFGYIYVPQEKIMGIKKDELRALLVTGDSTTGDGIHDRDFVAFCTTQKEIINGKIYICRAEGGGVTIKRVYLENGKVRLKASNPVYKDIVLTEIEILGRVVCFQGPITEV